MRADDDERHAERLRGGERGQRVLARLDGADEQEVPVVTVAGRAEGGIGCERRDGDLLLRNPVQLDEIVARPQGDREHGAARRAERGTTTLKIERSRRPMTRQIPLEGEVLHGEHGRAREARRQRVHEMGERGPEAAQQERQPQTIRSSCRRVRQLDRRGSPRGTRSGRRVTAAKREAVADAGSACRRP